MATKTPTVPGVFTRASSGLVRQVGTLDAVYYGVMAITIAYMVFIVAAIPIYVGASIEWSTVITMVGAIALGLVYALFAAVYPRSGGEYVFLSRTVHPDSSPAAIRVAGVPLLTIAAVVAIPYLGLLIWRTVVDTAYGANTTISVVVNIVVFVVGIAWFFGVRAYRKQQGVDVDRQFKEIPVDNPNTPRPRSWAAPWIAAATAPTSPRHTISCEWHEISPSG
jgi:amino acid transporter